jgi:uncharacterized damage-inducible protein DinB
MTSLWNPHKSPESGRNPGGNPADNPMTQNETLARLFVDDSAELIRQSVSKLQHCLNQLSDEQVWWRPQAGANSIGNLILHVCGNLRQWTICGLGGLPDDRDRQNEFSPNRQLTIPELNSHLRTVCDQCLEWIAGIDVPQLTAEYRIQGFQVNGLQALNHTVTHFVGHTHQVIYITRLQLGDAYQFAWTPESERSSLPI